MEKSDGSMLDNLQDFLSLPLPIVFFRGAASLSSLSSELSDARLRQLYRRPRERFAADNRNRLQTFRMAPAAISTPLLFLLFRPLYPLSTGDNKQYKHPTSTASQRQQSRRQSYCPRLAIRPTCPPRVRGRATTIVRPENEHEDYDRRRLFRRRRDFVGICLSSWPSFSQGVLSFPVLLLYLRFLALNITWLCTQMRARKSANMMDRAHVDELLSGMNVFFFTIFFYDRYFAPLPPPSLSLSLYLYSHIEFFYCYI